jgi:parvulin-like peptidyl-prolyl isomerase
MRNLLLPITVVLVGLSFSSCKKDTQFIAKVGKEKITETMLNEKLATTPAEYQKYANTPLGKKQFIDAVVRESIIVEAAKKEGIEKRAEYKTAVSDFKLEQDKQFKDYKNGLLVEIYIKELREKIKTTDEDIQKYYDDNKDSFENPVAYIVRHILVSDSQTAQSAYERLQSGESFEKVAKEVSQDAGSAANGGLIGPFRKGDSVPEFEQVVVNLKDNEMSGIVESPYGYHIIFKVSEQKLPHISFDEAKGKIKRTLEKERFDAWFANEKQNLKVEVNYDATDSVPVSSDEPQK